MATGEFWLSLGAFYSPTSLDELLMREFKSQMGH